MAIRRVERPYIVGNAPPSDCKEFDDRRSIVAAGRTVLRFGMGDHGFPPQNTLAEARPRGSEPLHSEIQRDRMIPAGAGGSGEILLSFRKWPTERSEAG